MFRLLFRLTRLTAKLLLLLALAPLLAGSAGTDCSVIAAEVQESQARIFGGGIVPCQRAVLGAFESGTPGGSVLRFVNFHDSLRLAALRLGCPLLLEFNSLLLLFCCALPGFLYLRRRAFYYRCSTERQDRVWNLLLVLLSVLLYLDAVQCVRPRLTAEAMLLPLWTAALAARVAAWWSCPR